MSKGRPSGRHGRPVMGPMDRDVRQLAGAAGTGALIGAAGAAALGLHRVRHQEQTPADALSDTIRAGAATGAATAAAAAVSSMVGRSPMLSLATAFATATAVSYVFLEAGGHRDHA